MKIIAIISMILAGVMMIQPAVGQDVAPVILTNVEVVTVDDTSASVSWVTNTPSDARIQWGETSDLGSETVIDESVNCHIIFIDDLSPGTIYHYRIGSGGKWSDIDTITTLNPNGTFSGIRVALIADTHYDSDAPNTPSGTMLGDGPEILDSLVPEVNEKDIDLAIFLGDSVNGAEEDYAGFSSSITGLTIPKYYVMGNWEKNEEGWSDYASQYLGIDETYTSFDQGGYHFVILDSAVAGEIGGSLDQTQLDWFESDLQSKPYKPTIVLFHHTLHGEGVMGLDDGSREKLISILDHNGQVISVISGHNHKNTRIDGGNQRDHITVASTIQYPIGYSIIDLYDEGYSQSFYKVEAALSISEESRILMDASSASSEADEEYLGTIPDRNYFRQIPDDHALILESVIIDPEMVYPGEEAVITVNAYDPDHEEIEYKYSVDGGKVIGTGSEVTWVAPDVPGTFDVRITLSSGQHKILTTGDLVVLERNGDIPNRAPIIDSLTASKYSVQPDEVIDIEAEGSDPDGDEITYEFSATGGEIIGSGDSVEWKAPGSPGDYRITATASDGELTSQPISIAISVIEPEPEKEEEAGSTDAGDPSLTIIMAISAFLIMIFISKKHNGMIRR